MKDVIFIDGMECDLRDVMNPPGTFLGSKRQREYSAMSDPLPSSGKLLPEFFGRRNIRDMFARKSSLLQSQTDDISSHDAEVSGVNAPVQGNSTTNMLGSNHGTAEELRDSAVKVLTSSPSAVSKKRPIPVTTGSKAIKRGKSRSTIAAPPVASKGQQSLKGFFKPSATLTTSVASAFQGSPAVQTSLNDDNVSRAVGLAADSVETHPAIDKLVEAAILDPTVCTPRNIDAWHIPSESQSANASPIGDHRAVIQSQESVHDPIESKASWSKLFTKPVAPRCEGHGEPCISLLTKKSGMNLGRSFWMCSRPLGPSGAKEKNTQWRCQTFIWCSDWNPNAINV